MFPLCPGLGPEQLASSRKPGQVPPKPLEVSGLAGLGLAGKAPFLSLRVSWPRPGPVLERQVGCDWTGLELASWPEKPQPSSESIPSLGKGEVGSINGVFPAGGSLAPPPSLNPLLSALSRPSPPYLLEGGF